jgi:indole-3-glycerol phosphate synthase
VPAHLAVRYDAEQKTWQVTHVARDGGLNVLMEVHDHSDAVKIARGIASWTSLPVIER